MIKKKKKTIKLFKLVSHALIVLSGILLLKILWGLVCTLNI